ncbi:hypothetical protein [Sinirhodobacter huangdaonensis]|uniref:Uncharacterized protein n=1 Tax=Paenirhodobacter huangdaonensis TaxID=2501515 RepID=A0A443LQX4_9RHOB|nr:hypothetical protein [Sinirhodobacter huangdaonensis]RWR51569.1 hypothetical protein EOW66_11335 [Sinirhodobacter huangdaonensis]
MPNYWRSGEGRAVIDTAARWVLAEAALRGLTVWDYIDGRCSLAELGVTADGAARTLKPLMPDAHRHYNEHGGGNERYQTWEAWFSKRLRNRIFYFFHRHAPGGGVRRCLAEWPLAEPQRRADLAVAAE